MLLRCCYSSKKPDRTRTIRYLFFNTANAESRKIVKKKTNFFQAGNVQEMTRVRQIEENISMEQIPLHN
jgi:hypothetical protein